MLFDIRNSFSGLHCYTQLLSQTGLALSFFFRQQGTVMRQLVFAQKMIQSDTHQGRLEYFKDILDEEYRASIAKKSLKNL